MGKRLRQGFRLGEWDVRPVEGTISGRAGNVHLEPKVMEVLVCLAANAGRLTERDLLLESVWGPRAVSDEPLTRCVAALRKVLRDDPRNPKYIQTVPKRGYRLVCPVAPARDRTTGRRLVDIRLRPLHAGGAAIVSLLVAAVVLLPEAGPVDPSTRPDIVALPPSAADTGTSSVAVLPFRSVGGDNEDMSFVDGIHDDIITRLVNIPSIDRVISRVSSARYRDTDKPMRVVGRELGVETILGGSMRRAGSRIRINAQLVDAATDENIWAGTFDRELTVDNIFAIQSDIAREVATALHVTLGDEDESRLMSFPTRSLEAYEQFVLGRQAMVTRRKVDLEKAERHFDKAIEIDAEFALAYVGLADAIGLQTRNLGRYVEGSIERREALLERALQLDPDSGEAYASLGLLKMNQFRTDEAERYLRRAIELSPNYSDAFNWLGLLLRSSGRPEEALSPTRRAARLDPAAPVNKLNLGANLAILGRVEEALGLWEEGIDLEPGFAPFYSATASQLWQAGRIADALRWMQEARALSPSNAAVAFQVCLLYLGLGDDLSAERCMDEAERDFPDNDLVARALLHEYRGQPGRALEVLLAYQDKGKDPLAQLLIAGQYAKLGEYENALRLLRKYTPKLLDDVPVTLTPADLPAAVTAGYVLWNVGDKDRANSLLDDALAVMQRMHRTRGAGYDVLDVRIHAIRGDSARAVAGLREAIDAGWRRGWWQLRGTVFEAMKADADWSSLIEKLEKDVAQQRTWYDEHKNDPLL